MNEALDQIIKAVCPIHGVSIDRREDKGTWRVGFKDEATASQVLAAQATPDEVRCCQVVRGKPVGISSACY